MENLPPVDRPAASLIPGNPHTEESKAPGGIGDAQSQILSMDDDYTAMSEENCCTGCFVPFLLGCFSSIINGFITLFQLCTGTLPNHEAETQELHRLREKMDILSPFIANWSQRAALWNAGEYGMGFTTGYSRLPQAIRTDVVAYFREQHQQEIANSVTAIGEDHVLEFVMRGHPDTVLDRLKAHWTQAYREYERIYREITPCSL
jgi:hypothetical protein